MVYNITMKTTEVLYPEKPYKIAKSITFKSGFVRDLVAYGRKCTECHSIDTYLDGGVARCIDHVEPLCIHGAVVCGGCNKY
jgi:hypothetical protein